MKTPYTLLVHCGEDPPVIGEYPSQMASNVELSFDVQEQLSIALKSQVW